MLRKVKGGFMFALKKQSWFTIMVLCLKVYVAGTLLCVLLHHESGV